MKAKQLATLALALSAATANAAFVGVEDFQAYTTGNVGTSSAFVSNSGPWTGWTGTSSNTGSSLIGLSAQSDGNKYLRYGWTSGARGAYLNTAPAISNTQAGIYYFQARRSTTTNGNNVSYGLMDAADPTNGLADFNVLVSLETSGSSFNLVAQNGNTPTTLATGLAIGVWHDIWLDVNNATDSFDVYLGSSGNPDNLGTRVGNNLAFAKPTNNSLVNFATLSNNISNNSAHLDNLAFQAVPVPAPTSFAIGAVGGLLMLCRRR